MESIIARKAEEAGKVLDAKEEEYVRLQVERNQLLQLFPQSESRAEDVLKRIQQIKDRIKKLTKGRPKEDLLKIPFKSTQPKSGAERTSAWRRNKSLEAREREREDDQKRKASPDYRARDANRKRKKRREERIGREKEDESPRAPQLSDSKGGGGNLKVKLPSDDLNQHMDQYSKTLSRPTVEGPTYSLDQPLRIRVEFTCYPPPTIVWLKDGKVLARDTIKFAPKEGVTSSADCKKERVAPKSQLRFQVESYYRFKMAATSETRHLSGAFGETRVGDPFYKEERKFPPQLMQQGWSDFLIPEPKPIDEGIYEARVFNSFGLVEDFIKVRHLKPLEFPMVEMNFWTILLPCNFLSGELSATDPPRYLHESDNFFTGQSGGPGAQRR